MNREEKKDLKEKDNPKVEKTETKGNQDAIPAPMRSDIDLKDIRPRRRKLRKGTLTNAEVKGQPGDPREETEVKEARIQYLRAKSDRTLEEGLELQELELGIKKSAQLNSGWTSGKVHEDQKILRENDKEVREANLQIDDLHAVN